MTPNIWDQALSLPVLVTLGLVAAGFLPLLYSVWQTYLENKEKRTTQHRHE